MIDRHIAWANNLLYSVSTVPISWKRAVIMPVFMEDAAGFVYNYRPISLTCVASKFMEHVILPNNFTTILLQNNLLFSAQHGFVNGRSTWTLTVQNYHRVYRFHKSIRHCYGAFVSDSWATYDWTDVMFILSALNLRRKFFYVCIFKAVAFAQKKTEDNYFCNLKNKHFYS